MRRATILVYCIVPKLIMRVTGAVSGETYV